ncbi:MAG: methyl-accepting chemotaxis protein [Oscillatoriaceae cyanobacterium Prado104]|jgi:methyl-accepting chemotaxis protein|nr:methyl-accepting chemotaxis protein [Oscillatoriaceae cyanobacterium Prado104]
MFYKLKLKNSILLGYLIPILCLIFMGVFFYARAVNKERLSQKVKRAQNTIISAINVTNGMSKMVRNLRGYVLFPEDKSYESNYEAGWKLYQSAAAELKNNLKDSQEQQEFKTIQNEVKRLDGISREAIRLLKQGNLQAAKNLTNQVRLLEVEKAQERILAKEREFLAAASKVEANETRLLLKAIALSTVLSVLGSLSIGLIVASKIAKMINQTVAAIAKSSVEIVATVEQQESTIGHQAAAVNQTTITMDELGASSKSTAQQAESAATGAMQALNLAGGGSETVNRTLEGMKVLREQAEAVAAQIQHLNEQTNQIANISDLVSELASQTNMLALNAAVEAVRAGENGRGFAVIAGEIRHLADRSKKSAEKINNLIVDIQSAIGATVTATSEGAHTAGEGMKLTKSTAQAFNDVVNAINNIAISTQQISLTAQQQALAVEQVVEAMKTLDRGAAQTAIGISQTKFTTHNLNEAARNLQELL